MKITIQDYADLCKVSRQTIWNRIKSKHNPITTEENKDMGYIVHVIDTDIFPPTEEKSKPGRKKFKQGLSR